MQLSELRQLRQLEDENRQLRTIVVDQALDHQAFKDVPAKTCPVGILHLLPDIPCPRSCGDGIRRLFRIFRFPIADYLLTRITSFLASNVMKRKDFFETWIGREKQKKMAKTKIALVP